MDYRPGHRQQWRWCDDKGITALYTVVVNACNKKMGDTESIARALCRRIGVAGVGQSDDVTGTSSCSSL